MKIDIEFYRTSKADFMSVLKRRKVKTWNEINAEISLYCACVGLPVIAAVAFVEEDYPQFKEELDKKKQVIKEFYGYEF